MLCALLPLLTIILSAEALAPPKHVVVLMMENQSFDRLFGWCPECGGELKPNEYWNEDAQGRRIYVTQGQDPHKGNAYDPCHGNRCMLDQMYGPGKYKAPGGKPTGEGYVKAQQPNLNTTGLESYFRFFDAESAVPNLYKLARRYVVLSRWFASLPGPTGPNRLFAACASSGGYVGTNYAPGGFKIGVPLPSIYELLGNESVTWRYYEDHLEPSSLGTARGLRYLQQNKDRWFPVKKFHEDVKADKLAQYSWLVPSLGRGSQDSWHPGTAGGSMEPGDQLVGEIYHTLVGTPEVFEKTVLLIVFDEAGGFWDSHLPQGLVSAPEFSEKNWWPSDGPTTPFDFRTRGPRVPAILVHPHLPHRVDPSVYEHSSIPKTVRELFAPRAKPLSVREAESGNFLTNNDFQ